MTKVRPERLTQRHLQVLALIAEGNTNACIGRALNLSVDGTKYEVRSLYDILGARDRAHAVHLGHLRGLLPVAVAS